jgi:tetratricopeptide (TPR) repeat protein
MMEDTRAAKIKEAQRLRDLGFYNEAIQWYEEAEEERIDILLALEIGSTFLEQGPVKAALEKIHHAKDVFGDSIEDESALGLARLLDAFATAFTTAQFTPSLEICGRTYDQLLRDRPLEKFGKILVSPIWGG